MIKGYQKYRPSSIYLSGGGKTLIWSCFPSKEDMCTLVSNLRAQKNWFAIQRRKWGRGESGRIWIQFPKTASLNVDRQLLGMDIMHYNALSTLAWVWSKKYYFQINRVQCSYYICCSNIPPCRAEALNCYGKVSIFYHNWRKSRLKQCQILLGSEGGSV